MGNTRAEIFGLIKTWNKDGFVGSTGVSMSGFQFLTEDGAVRVNMPMRVTSSCSVIRPSSLMVYRNRAAFSSSGLTLVPQECVFFSVDILFVLEVLVYW